MLVHPDGTREPLAIGLPGDRDVDEKRLEAQVHPAEVAAFDEAAFAANPALVKGYIGPGALGEEGTARVRYLLDPRVVEGTRWVTGANEPGRHVLDLVAGRDFTADGTIEAAEVRAGDVCPSCGEGVLETARGIEMGHIFALGRKFADALGLKVLDQNGKQVTVTMGSYGVGVSRAVAAVAEGNHDEVGLVLAARLAPADVHVVATGKDEERLHHGRRAERRPRAPGVSVLYDDRRKVSPGREVQGRRADRGADDRGGRAQPGRGHGRGPRPPHRRQARRPGRASRRRDRGRGPRHRRPDARP